MSIKYYFTKIQYGPLVYVHVKLGLVASVRSEYLWDLSLAIWKISPWLWVFVSVQSFRATPCSAACRAFLVTFRAVLELIYAQGV